MVMHYNVAPCSSQLFKGGGSSSSTGMAAVVSSNRTQEKCILTSRAVYANHLTRIGISNGNNDSTGREIEIYK